MWPVVAVLLILFLFAVGKAQPEEPPPPNGNGDGNGEPPPQPTPDDREYYVTSMANVRISGNSANFTVDKILTFSARIDNSGSEEARYKVWTYFISPSGKRWFMDSQVGTVSPQTDKYAGYAMMKLKEAGVWQVEVKILADGLKRGDTMMFGRPQEWWTV